MKSEKKNEKIILKSLPFLLIAFFALSGCTNAPDEGKGFNTDYKGLVDKTAKPPVNIDKDGDGFISYDEASTLPCMNEDLFKRMDRNGDGRVSVDELPPPPPHRGMGFKHHKMPLPSEIDKDGDGFISNEEASVLPFMNEDLFKRMDRNGDGRISVDELPPPPPPLCGNDDSLTTSP